MGKAPGSAEIHVWQVVGIESLLRIDSMRKDSIRRLRNRWTFKKSTSSKLHGSLSVGEDLGKISEQFTDINILPLCLL